MNNDLIMELLNCSIFYIVILDMNMKIRFVNNSLVTSLGFQSDESLIDRCWLDFIPDEDVDNIKKVHSSTLHGHSGDFNEYSNSVLDITGSKFEVKWFNVLINHGTDWSFSFGLPYEKQREITKEGIRKNFRSMIESDKTLIRSLKEHVNGIGPQFGIDEDCNITE
jgi:PAS domain S-box-containing protein